MANHQKSESSRSQMPQQVICTGQYLHLRGFSSTLSNAHKIDYAEIMIHVKTWI